MPDWEVSFRCADADEDGWQLIEAGALGVEVLGETSLRAFFRGEEEEVRRFEERAGEAGFELLGSAELPETNYTQLSGELMQPLEVGSLRICPIASAESAPLRLSETTLLLIPGAGFGTGHHVSTEMALELLQEAALA